MPERDEAPRPLRSSGFGATPTADERRAALIRQIRLLGFGMLVVLVGGFASGIIFGKVNPTSAARAQLGNLVAFEDDLDTPGIDPGFLERDPAALTSGSPRGDVACGIRSTPVDDDTMRGTVAAGVVVVQYRPADTDAAEVRELEEFTQARPGQVLLVANPDIEDAFSVTGWLRRMTASAPVVAQTESFVVGYGGLGPSDAECVT